MFIEVVEKNNGELISIDIDDYSHLFNSKIGNLSSQEMIILNLY